MRPDFVNEAGDFGATIWRMPEHSKGSSQLEKLADLNGHTKKIKWYRFPMFF